MLNRLFQRTTPYLILFVTLACAPIAAQTAIPSPLLVLQDPANDGAALPLFEVIGGSQSSTLGAEITSQSQSTIPISFEPWAYCGYWLWRLISRTN